MKKVLHFAGLPDKSGYFGGIAFIVSKYINNSNFFKLNNCELDIFNTESENLLVNMKKSKLLFHIKKTRIILKELKIKIINNSPQLLHIHTSRKITFFRDLFIASQIKKVLKGKIIFTIHFAEITKILTSFKPIIKVSIWLMNRVIDKVIFLSEETKKDFILNGLNSNRTEVLYTFHDEIFTSEDLEEKLYSINRKKSLDILFIGSIDRRKGIMDLLDVMINLNSNKVFLHICGKITQKDIEEDFYKKCNLIKGQVKFHGYVLSEQKHQILFQNNILVLPSYGEGMPIVIMEAMAAGCAILTTRVGAIPEIIQEGIQGYLFNSGDKNSITNLINKLCQDRDLLYKLSLNSIETANEFSLSNNINKLCIIYNKLSSN